MQATTIELVLRHSSDLQQAGSLGDLLRVTGEAVRSITSYREMWLAWFDPLDDSQVRVLGSSAAIEDIIWETSPMIPRAADAMLEEIAQGHRPVVVEDARADPRTNKAMVERFGNRTIINIPVVLAGEVRGALGTGTFAPEGPRLPTERELDALVLFATQLAPAFDRVRALEDRDRMERERHSIEQHLESLQRVELMGLLAAGVAHDLNNLLGMAMSSVETAALDPSGSRSSLTDALRALGRMRELSRQLLQLGHPADDKRVKVRLSQQVGSTLELVRPSIPPGVSVDYQHTGEPIVDADPVQLEQAVANLVINARDAVGSRGNIHLSVDHRTLDDRTASTLRGGRAGSFARLSVSDSGPGIPRELLERVFDPLFTTKQLGTGLGLAVVTRITEQHRGFVTVQSEMGRGATFELYLPSTQ